MTVYGTKIQSDSEFLLDLSGVAQVQFKERIE
jgi:hypothetical protein